MIPLQFIDKPKGFQRGYPATKKKLPKCPDELRLQLLEVGFVRIPLLLEGRLGGKQLMSVPTCGSLDGLCATWRLPKPWRLCWTSPSLNRRRQILRLLCIQQYPAECSGAQVHSAAMASGQVLLALVRLSRSCGPKCEPRARNPEQAAIATRVFQFVQAPPKPQRAAMRVSESGLLPPL